MPAPLRNGLWDVCLMFYFEDAYSKYGEPNKSFMFLTFKIWLNFLREPTDDRPERASGIKREIRDRFFRFEFYDVYKFIEFLASEDKETGAKFVEICNNILEREKSAFRFADRQLVKISDQQELNEIEESITRNAALGVRDHISLAARHYSSSPPDYRNSIKEAISAVEGAVFYLTEKKSNGISGPLKDIKIKYGLHPAFVVAFEKLYGYTSEKDGIRHAILEKKEIDQNEARYMLVACSAASNFLVSLKQD